MGEKTGRYLLARPFFLTLFTTNAEAYNDCVSRLMK
jgi:hypothetical protein